MFGGKAPGTFYWFALKSEQIINDGNPRGFYSIFGEISYIIAETSRVL